MSHLIRNRKLRVFGFRMLLTLLLTISSLASCNKSEKTTSGKSRPKDFRVPG